MRGSSNGADRPPPVEPLYAEVWGDTVTLPHLAGAVLIGAAGALGAYLLASHLLAVLLRNPVLARTDAMLFGLLGCILSGALCARLFSPKRVLGVDDGDGTARGEALDRLAADPRGIGRVASLPAPVLREMEALELLEPFRRRERAP